MTLDGARKKALQSDEDRAREAPATILFGLRTTLRPGTSIRESGRRPPISGIQHARRCAAS